MRSTSTGVDCELADEFADKMVTVLTKPARTFSPDVPGAELGDQLVYSVCSTGESRLQSVCDRDSAEGPGTGVCQPGEGKGKVKLLTIYCCIKY